MANESKMFPFLRKWEGKYANNPADRGGETMIGVTYTLWCSIFGTDCHDRFLAMAPEDWEKCTAYFWNAVLGDQIISERIAHTMFDWAWGSGKYNPDHDLQHILNVCFHAGLVEDGNPGKLTLDAINSADEPTLWEALKKARFQYYQDCVTAHPQNAEFLNGWNNRMNDLILFEENPDAWTA
jgi:lysozyme family protein